MLTVRVKKHIGALELNIAFEAGNCGILVLRGVSGAGKTTLARMVSGLVEPDSGEIALEGLTVFSSAKSINLRPEARGIGCVFQEPRLFPHLSVRENILFPVSVGKRQPAVGFDDAVCALGLAPLLDRMPATLSGGEAQRTAIGRALMAAERLLVLDEPLSSLDPARRRRLIPYILKAASLLRVPVLSITHSDEETRGLCGPLGRALELVDGELRPYSLS